MVAVQNRACLRADDGGGAAGQSTGAALTERIGAPATIAVGAASSALACPAFSGSGRAPAIWRCARNLILIGGGLGLLVPPLTSTLLGSVEKAAFGHCRRRAQCARQTGSVLGVALFGSLAGQHNTLLQGAILAGISAGLLLVAAAVIWFGASRQHAMKV